MICLRSVSCLCDSTEDFGLTVGANLGISAFQAFAKLVILPFKFFVFGMIRVFGEVLGQGSSEEMLVLQASIAENAVCVVFGP